PRPDAQGRRHHGRDRRRPGAHRRGGRCLRRHGPRARPCRHSQGWWCRPHVRPRRHPRDPGRRHHPRHGQGPHRPLCRVPDPRGPRRRLH
ncbi:hypothetical protein BN1708_019538, partial [Verticillium longisporum]